MTVGDFQRIRLTRDDHPVVLIDGGDDRALTAAAYYDSDRAGAVLLVADRVTIRAAHEAEEFPDARRLMEMFRGHNPDAPVYVVGDLREDDAFEITSAGVVRGRFEVKFDTSRRTPDDPIDLVRPPDIGDSEIGPGIGLEGRR